MSKLPGAMVTFTQPRAFAVAVRVGTGKPAMTVASGGRVVVVVVVRVVVLVSSRKLT